MRISAAIAGAPQARSNRLLLMRTRAKGKCCLTATALGASVRHRRPLFNRKALTSGCMDGRACTHRHADICQASRYKQAGRQAGLRILAAIAGAPQAPTFYKGCENEKSFSPLSEHFCSKPSQNFCISCFGTTCFSGSLWSNVAFLALKPHTFPVHCGLMLLFLPWDHTLFRFTVV